MLLIFLQSPISMKTPSPSQTKPPGTSGKLSTTSPPNLSPIDVHEIWVSETLQS